MFLAASNTSKTDDTSGVYPIQSTAFPGSKIGGRDDDHDPEPVPPAINSIDIDDEYEEAVATVQPATPLIRTHFPEAEPWFYPFLHKDAEAWKRTAYIVVAVSGAWWLLSVIFFIYQLLSMPVEENPLFTAMGLWLTFIVFGLTSTVQALVTYLIYRSIMLVSAWIHLAVDQARNIRRSRMRHETN